MTFIISKVIFDVDGVFTNGQFIYSSEGKVFKTFGAHDADGIRMLQDAEISVQAITADTRGFAITSKRMLDMNIPLEIVSESQRIEYIKTMQARAPICFVGDGHYDAQAFRHASYSIAPKNAVPLAQKSAHFVTKAKGGEGAVYEAALHLLNKLEEGPLEVHF